MDREKPITNMFEMAVEIVYALRNSKEFILVAALVGVTYISMIHVSQRYELLLNRNIQVMDSIRKSVEHNTIAIKQLTEELEAQKQLDEARRGK
jgi:hypothetical protein